MFVGPIIALANEGADGGGRRVEDRDFVAFDDIPKAVEGGIVGRAFVDNSSCAGGEWAVDDVTVARDPTDVGSAPIDVFGAEIEDPFHSHRGLEEIAGGGVENAFGFAGGAGGVKDEEGMFGVEGFGGTGFGGLSVS